MKTSFDRYLKEAQDKYSALIYQIISRSDYIQRTPYLFTRENGFQAGVIGAALALKNCRTHTPSMEHITHYINAAIRTEMINVEGKRPKKRAGQIDRYLSQRSEIADICTRYRAGNNMTGHHYADRIAQCGFQFLLKGQPILWFCKVRHCPVCQSIHAWRWQQRLTTAFSSLMEDFPRINFFLLSLSTGDFRVESLRATLYHISASWKRLIELRTWHIRGFVRILKITLNNKGWVNPQYRCLLAAGEITTDQDLWARRWQESLRAPYLPMVVILPCPLESVIETLSIYLAEPEENPKSPELFQTFSSQVWKIRTITLGGIIKKYIRRED